MLLGFGSIRQVFCPPEVRYLIGDLVKCNLLIYRGAIYLQKDQLKTVTAGLDVVQSGRPIFDDFFQHLWPYIGNNTANAVFQMVKRLWFIRIDQ
ncbi:hypothetical protein TNCV_3174151 [Trichonephila clavipes]|nr:hypothetical protein TNCV_3174151 [Trichonephila clavipes]